MSEPTTQTRRIRGGALLVIAVLLISSAGLRIGVQAGDTVAHKVPDPVEQQPDIGPGQMPSGMAGSEPDPSDLQRLLSALLNREQQLNRRETQIQDRMKALEIADEAIDRKLAALVDAEERLSATLAMADGASEEDLARLTDVYGKMKPKDASALFEEMAPEFAAGFLGRMRPTAAASIMAGLDPKTAYTISVILAGRNAWVPKE